MRMKKTTINMGFLTALAVLIFAGQTFAFCVHNKTSDARFNVYQSSGGSFWRYFKATLAPGENGCCHWSNTDCNKDGGKGDTVGFEVIIWGSENYICKGATIPACSDLDITGSNGNYQCIAHGMETCN